MVTMWKAELLVPNLCRLLDAFTRRAWKCYYAWRDEESHLCRPIKDETDDIRRAVKLACHAIEPPTGVTETQFATCIVDDVRTAWELLLRTTYLDPIAIDGEYAVDGIHRRDIEERVPLILTRLDESLHHIEHMVQVREAARKKPVVLHLMDEETEAAPPENLPDGPVRDDGFRWKGREYYDLRAKPWLLLEAIWRAKDRTLTYDDLAVPVYREHGREVTKGMVNGLQTPLNRFFKKNAIPLFLTAPVQTRTVRLIDRPQ